MLDNPIALAILPSMIDLIFQLCSCLHRDGDRNFARQFGKLHAVDLHGHRRDFYVRCSRWHDPGIELGPRASLHLSRAARSKVSCWSRNQSDQMME